jgi:hypothetical protein
MNSMENLGGDIFIFGKAWKMIIYLRIWMWPVSRHPGTLMKNK